MELLQSLTESKLFASKTSFARYTGRDLAELTYLHIICLRIISCEDVTYQHAKQYALKTNNHDGFKKWRQSATDLYYLLYALEGDAKPHDETSKHYIKALHLDIAKITAWLLSISSRNSMSETRAQRLFVTLDNQFKINNGSYRSIRRLAMSWPDLSLRERQLCFTRLMQLMRQRATNSDVMFDLIRLDKINGLELEDACERETGKCGTETSLSQAAAHHRINEDDCAAPAPAANGATTSADFAPLVKPLGKLRRRNPK